MTITPEQLLPLLVILPVASLFFNFALMIFLIIFIQKGKMKPREQQELEHHMMEVIKQAEVRSTEIIEDATKKAHKVIMEAQDTKHTIEEKLDKFVLDTTNTAQNKLDEQQGLIVSRFTEAYGRLVEQFEGETQILISNLQHEARAMQGEFKKTLHDDSVAILNKMKENMDTQIMSVNAEIKEYRDRTFAKIDEQVQVLIKQYVADYFQTQLTPETHENILFKAFDKFKQTINTPPKP